MLQILEDQHAAYQNNTKSVKILSPLSDNPNAPGPNNEWTPIQYAAHHNNTKIIKILAPLSENPNAPNPEGLTPLQCAARKNNIDIQKILAPDWVLFVR